MRLLREYYYEGDADAEAYLLEEKGILTFVSSRNAVKIPMSRGGSDKVGLWVVLNHQYFDAFSYMNDRKHRVTTGLESSELAALKKKGLEGAGGSLYKISILAFLAIMAFCIVAYFVFVAL